MPKIEKAAPMHFESISRAELPQGRNGKHKQAVLELLGNLELLPAGQALKVRISQLPDSKENIRSALNRATRQRKMNVATSTDANYLYIWKSESKSKAD
jgi:hypothetical protein